jgi:hypothetical protein
LWNFRLPLIEGKKDKRRRLSSFAISDIIDKIYPIIFINEITHIIIVSKVYSRFIIKSLRRSLRVYGLKFYGHIKEFVNPHNGVKLRRKKRK